MDSAQYTQCYVAFLDILGFKDLIINPKTTCQSIVSIYESFGRMHETFFSGDDDDSRKKSIKLKVMSDSICCYIASEIPNALYCLASFCTAFQYDLLTLSPSIFLRGGISFGELYAKEDVVFGPALTEAYILEEKNAKVPRIIIRKSTLDHGLNKIEDESARKTLLGLTFRDFDAFYTLDYFTLICFNSSRKTENRVMEIISKQLDTAIDESIRQKYLYIEQNIQKYQRLREGKHA